jgi:hypothetical protein
MQRYNVEVAKDRSAFPTLRDCAVAFVSSSKIDRSLNGPVNLDHDFLSPASPEIQKLDSLPGRETKDPLEDKLSDSKSAQARSRQVMWKVAYR